MEQSQTGRECVSVCKGSLSRQRQSDIIVSKDLSVFGGAGLHVTGISTI